MDLPDPGVPKIKHKKTLQYSKKAANLGTPWIPDAKKEKFTKLWTTSLGNPGSAIPSVSLSKTNAKKKNIYTVLYIEHFTYIQRFQGNIVYET